MPNKTEKGKKGKSRKAIPAKFHERFDIELDIDEVKKRFMNRISNQIFDDFFENKFDEETRKGIILWQVANVLGKSFYWDYGFSTYIGMDFHKYLQAVEVFYNALVDDALKRELESLINFVLAKSEVDLGVKWENGQFIRSGARLLDEKLVNENLRWLENPEYESVYTPFVKGLSHFLKAEKDPKLLYDVITDMYEAVEGLSKIVTGKHDKDLSANAELFISKIKVSPNYKKILKEYISYANDFRHALKKGQKRPKLSMNEVESFVYLTGLFIRLGSERVQK